MSHSSAFTRRSLDARYTVQMGPRAARRRRRPLANASFRRLAKPSKSSWVATKRRRFYSTAHTDRNQVDVANVQPVEGGEEPKRGERGGGGGGGSGSSGGHTLHVLSRGR